MIKIISIMMKNFKLVFRSKVSAIILILGPLFIMLAVGMVYNNAASLNINIGTHTNKTSDLTDSLVNVLKSQFTVTQFDTTRECRDGIKSGDIHICIEFPPNMKVEQGARNNIIFMVDDSKLNLVDSVIKSIGDLLNNEARKISMGKTQEVVQSLNFSKTESENLIPIIKQILNDTGNETIRLINITRRIDGIDISFNKETVDLDEVKKVSSNIKTNIAKMQQEAHYAAGTILLTAEDFDNKIDAETAKLNVTGADQTVVTGLVTASEALLTSAREDSIDARLDFDTYYNQTKDQSDQIEQTINNVDTRLDEIENRFDKADDKRDDEVDNLELVTSDLTATRGKIINVFDSIGLIKAAAYETEITDVSTLVNPISYETEKVTVQNRLVFMVPYFIILIIMLITMLLSSTLIVMEKSSSANFRNFVTPTRDFVFILGAYLTTVCLIVLQMIILFSFLKLIAIFPFTPFDVTILNVILDSVTGNFIPTAMIIFAAATLFSFMGMAIGNLLNSEETSTLTSISLGSIFLFVSDFISPLERVPPEIAHLIRLYNPFVIASDLLKRAMLYPDKFTFGLISDRVYLMLGYATVLFVLMIGIHKLQKKYFLLLFSGYVTRKEMKKRMKQLDDNKLLEISQNVSKEHYFKTTDNRTIDTLPGLIKEIEKMDDEKLSKYIKGDENKFADWIMQALKNDRLARKVKKTRNKKKILKVLIAGQQEYDKIKAKVKVEKDEAKEIEDAKGDKEEKEEKKDDKKEDKKK